MVFVIKATLKDETRRLVFDGNDFPSYGSIQHKVSDGGSQMKGFIVISQISLPISSVLSGADAILDPLNHHYPLIRPMHPH